MQCIRCQNAPRHKDYDLCFGCFTALTQLGRVYAIKYYPSSLLHYMGTQLVSGTVHNTLTTSPIAYEVEQRDTPVTGWRAYRLSLTGTLMGVRQEWTERRLVAECSDFIRDVQGQPRWHRSTPAETCAEHLEKCPQLCACGIYLRAKPENWGVHPEHFVVYARCLAYGVVAMDEDGNARASDVSIEALYVLRCDLSSVVGALSQYIDWEGVANTLRGRYGVPVTVTDSLEEDA